MSLAYQMLVAGRRKRENDAKMEQVSMFKTTWAMKALFTDIQVDRQLMRDNSEYIIKDGICHLEYVNYNISARIKEDLKELKSEFRKHNPDGVFMDWYILAKSLSITQLRMI